MGDAENALPPSKKRAAGKGLTRETALDDEEDVPELETGTFKRASDEVLATRRIVKVRRQHPNSAPSSNPFAGIRLVAPTESSASPAEATTKAQSVSENVVSDDTKGSGGSEEVKDGDSKQLDGKTDESEDKSATGESTADKEPIAEENAGGKSGVNQEQSKNDEQNENEDKNEVAEKSTTDKESEVDKEQTKDDNDTKNVDKEVNKVEGEELNAEGSNLKSFQQLSSGQNAFTGLAGTGFSTSSFSFGSISTDGSALGSGSGSIFGLKTDKPFGLGLSTNGSSVFGASGNSAASKSEGTGFPTKQEVVVETGEENEKVVFNADSILFEFADGGWKERGKGELKVNVTTSGTEKARLLMRARGNYRLILNARLYPEIKLTNMDKKGVTFACINSATEGKDGLSTFALKFKDVTIVEEFRAAVMAHKGETSTVLKTPENSPKASDD
ncbi:hypothetical protein L6164_004421 [Bauhinia variegata]|uniref:Uncharacterized protein n=1 Tax=Bauhinia variegata TaxID=167791 RepID=A0ACB9Q4E0_BAUVA|nr:hypothetical protein L6164_004421 [Bauhinia variegata]